MLFMYVRVKQYLINKLIFNLGESEDDMTLLPYNQDQSDSFEDDSYYPDSAYDCPTTPFPCQQTLPTVVVNDEFTMIEGAAICMYLADLYGQFLPEEEHKAEYYR